MNICELQTITTKSKSNIIKEGGKKEEKKDDVQIKKKKEKRNSSKGVGSSILDMSTPLIGPSITLMLP